MGITAEIINCFFIIDTSYQLRNDIKFKLEIFK